MVVLGFTVTDQKNKYVNGLKPTDLKVFEDDIPQKLSTFAEGARPLQQVLENGETRPLHSAEPAPAGAGAIPNPDAVNLRTEATGTNVFVLFDTSNYMYRGFVYASDAIADFIRGLDRADSIAVYTYSRNLSRGVPLESRPGAGHQRSAKGGRRRRFGALQLSAAHAPRCGESAGPQSCDRLLERPRQRQHGRARRCTRRRRG